MGAKTGIAWTDATWNPIRGCSMAKGSEAKGCLNCYAARLAARNLPELRSPTTGESFARILPSGPRWTGKVELIESQLLLPLRWRKPKRIFVNSMSDLFHEALSDEAIDRVFAVMALCPQHTFQVLTKRPDRMLAYMTNVKTLGCFSERFGVVWPATETGTVKVAPGIEFPVMTESWPLPNVHLGVSVEDPETAEARIPLLRQTPAAKRFVSYEPALRPIGFGRYLVDGSGPKFLDQIIIGGESGPKARPFDVQWAYDTIRQCRDAGVACFVKQLGAKAYESIDIKRDWRRNWTHRDRAGADPSEWPADLRVQELI